MAVAEEGFTARGGWGVDRGSDRIVACKKGLHFCFFVACLSIRAQSAVTSVKHNCHCFPEKSHLE